MLLNLANYELLNKALAKAEGKITRKEAKAVHKDLPPGGVWRTIRGHHVYIVNGKVVAGSLPKLRGKGAKKATKAHLKEYQEHIDKEAEKKKKKSAEDSKSKKEKSTTTKKTTKKKASTAKKTTAKKTTKKKTTSSNTAKKKTSTAKKTSAKKKATQKVKDIRTEAQKTREVSYDVGEKIGGARKDEAQRRDTFIAKPNLKNLEKLEQLGSKVAHKYVTKKNVLPTMDENYVTKQYHQGVELKAMMMKQLIYGRVATRPEDSPEARKEYVNAAQRLQDIIEPVKTWEEMKDVLRDMNNWLRMERVHKDKTIPELEERLKEAKTKAKNVKDKRLKDNWKIRAQALERELKFAKKNTGYNFGSLGDKLVNLFSNQRSLDSSLRTMEKKLSEKGDTWEKFLSPESQKELENRKPKRQNRREQWKREIPEQIQRKGGRKTPVKKPEDMVKHFGFRGVEFGHWVDDDSGKFHLQKASEAFHDLADILGLSDKDVSFNGKLAMAFGARGKGGSLAHYEPMKKVINLTKEGGSGALAHEWAHALDNLLWEHSHDFKKGSIGHASEGDYGPKMDEKVKEAYKMVMKNIKEGTAVQHVPRRQPKIQIPIRLHALYDKHNGDILKATQEYLRLARYDDEGMRDRKKVLELLGGSDKQMAKYEKERKRIQEEIPQALAQIHQEKTGESLASVPIPTNQSAFYTDAQSRGKYWQQDHELFARAFEAFVQDELEKNGRRNDYLVSGTKPGTGIKGATAKKQAEQVVNTLADGYPYPQGEERERINNAMRYLVKAIREAKSITKALEAVPMNRK
jgi:hypothetical protein